MTIEQKIVKCTQLIKEFVNADDLLQRAFLKTKIEILKTEIKEGSING